jgi:hypothetical protein
MPRKEKTNQDKKYFAIIDNSVGNHENDPFVVKKTNDAKEFIKKYGLPKHLTNEQLGFDIEAFRRGEIT